MALVVEDGNGLTNAEAYVSVAAFKSFCDGYGYSYAGKTDPQIEVALRQAADYIDTEFRYKGIRKAAAQAMEFPRDGLVDWSGHAVTGVPARVMRANSELAFKSFSGALREDLDRGGMVTSESVGPISRSYSPDAPGGKVYQQASKLLAPFVRGESTDDPVPFYSTSESPLFEVGMMDGGE